MAMEILVDLLCRTQAAIWRLPALALVNVSDPADKGWELNVALGKHAAVLVSIFFLTSSRCCCFFSFLRLLTALLQNLATSFLIPL